MKNLILTFLILFSLHGFSQEWSHKSRIRHFAAGAAIGGIGYEVGKYRGENKFLWTIGTATLAGVVKETSDSSRPNNHFNTSDILVTSLGSGFSYLVSEYFGVPGYVMIGAGTIGLGISMKFQ